MTSLPFSPARPLRLGTRGSPMALVQAAQVRQRLIDVYPALAADGAIETVVITTTGDKVRDRPLSEIGGKGLFVRELEMALDDGRIDAAVHSMKDVPSWLNAPYMIPVMLERDAPWDVFISRTARTLDDLPQGAVLGTSAPRRAALALAHRPDLRVVMFRGNADTRLEKLNNGEVDATFLSLSGLQRINRFDTQFTVMNADNMLPAAGQGAIGIEIMNNNSLLADFLQEINHLPSYYTVTAERTCLAELNGDCHSPLAAYATIDADGILHLTGLAARPDGSQIFRHSDSAPFADYLSLGLRVGKAIKDQLPADFFDVCVA